MDEPEYRALMAATLANRPLLVRGEPGVGKTQLAAAAAQLLGRPLVQHVVDARTESRDLLWTFDAVSRLAEAQLSGAIDRGEDEKQKARARLAVRNFVRPGPLWWAFCWQSAAHAANPDGAADVLAAGCESPWFTPPGWNAGDGCVVLIDEIDKAESDVPNGLLEALGARRFLPQEWPAPVVVEGVSPLVVITTNEERVLPDAFLRRCLVLRLALPKQDQELIRHLVDRGRAHFRRAGHERTTDDVLQQAAKMLVAARVRVRDILKVTPLPGQAEYLDLLRAAVEFSSDPGQQEQALKDIELFVLQKHASPST